MLFLRVQTRMHAAAALCAVQDSRLLAGLQQDVVLTLQAVLEGLDSSEGDSDQVGCAKTCEPSQL